MWLPRSCSVRIRRMADSKGDTSGATSVGSRVRVTVPDPDTDVSVTYAGVVIEDYADMVIDSGSWGGIGLRCIGGRSHSMTDG